MAEITGIAWTDHTFNPWIGCTAVSGACDHCYAETLVKRWGGDFSTRRRTSPANWKKPLLWNHKAEAAGVRRRVFCASLADVFDNQVPREWRDDLWVLIGSTPWLDWQLLTKRPSNIAKMLPVMDSTQPGYKPWNQRWPWPNVWIGTTVENQEEADRRIPHLLAVPAAKRFLSCEPLLGALDVRPWLPGDSGCESCDDGEGYGNRCARTDIPRNEQCPARFEVVDHIEGPMGEDGLPSWFSSKKRSVDWVICGGESGPGARPMHPDWAHDLRDQCAAADVPFFFKQWGEWLDADSETFQQLLVSHRRFETMGEYENPANGCYRVGKKLAGALLDGVQHQAFPV